jgi:eukaryotic-like serine/threonine-protein kinase
MSSRFTSTVARSHLVPADVGHIELDIGGDIGMNMPSPPQGLPFSAPERIGKYRVLSKLGEGATSDVYLCHDDFNNRDVAVKQVRASAHADSTDARFGERFFAAEAALVGRLQHPNVVQIFDAVPDPIAPYIVMEYVPGNTLRRYCRADSLLSLELVVEMGFKCAMALGYVFRQGLIHRDVKPANLLAVLTHGSVTDVKITDFGSVLNFESDVTQIYRVGSLAYMSPEQLDGSSLDCRADMYGLGAVLFHLIAGRPPFEAPAQAAMVHQVYNAQPASLCGLRSGLSPAVDEVVQRALAKNPDDRYANWDEFAQALSGLIAQKQVPRGQIQGVLDSERFNLLRGLEFFSQFGDVELWEVVHRAKWQRLSFGHALYRRGEEGRTFHIIAQGELEVFREGQKVAHLKAGTSVGEMAYLAPSEELRIHAADVIVVEPATTISFTPESLHQLAPSCRHLFDAAFIKVLVKRLHSAHEALAHPRRIL